MKSLHNYTLELTWLGNEKGTHHREDRFYEINISGKEKLVGSSDKPFFGDPSLYNPEDLLLSALSSCHMMSYLYVCRKAGIKIISYTDNPIGILEVNQQGTGHFKSVTLKPQVVLENSGMIDLATRLHTQAGELCFIANSVKFDISHEVKIS